MDTGGRVITEVVDDEDNEGYDSRNRIRNSLEKELKALSKEQERTDRLRIQLMSRISLLDGLPQMVGFTDVLAEESEHTADDADDENDSVAKRVYDRALCHIRVLEKELDEAHKELERLRLGC